MSLALRPGREADELGTCQVAAVVAVSLLPDHWVSAGLRELGALRGEMNIEQLRDGEGRRESEYNRKQRWKEKEEDRER